jgi:type II secretory pathway predicted ATPase ExeA/DNA-binding CsgD family transcriptional regulator
MLFFKIKKNPFSIKPNTNLIGLEDKKETLKKYVEGGNICFLNGPAGTGKSSMLKWFQSNLKGHKIVYLDGKELDEYFDLNNHLSQQRNFLQRILGLNPKNVVLLVDEAQDCLTSFVNTLQTTWNSDQVKSVVIAQISADLSHFPHSFKERIGRKMIRLRRLTEEEIIKLINMRTKSKHSFNEEALSLIAEKADYIPRRALEICEISYNGINKKKITAEDVENLLNKSEEELLLSEPVKLGEPKISLKDDALFPLEKVDSAEKLSPMQKKIVKILLEDRRTAKQLAKILNTSEGSVGKQLSELIKMNIIGVVNERRPKLYGILQSFKDNLDSKR